MLGELSWQPETNSSLDFPRSDGMLLVIVSEAGGLGGNPLEDVVNERIHDAHGLAGDTSLGVDLLQDLVNVDGVALLASLSPLLLIPSGGFACFSGGLLFAFLACDFAGHSSCSSLKVAIES